MNMLNITCSQKIEQKITRKINEANDKLSEYFNIPDVFHKSPIKINILRSREGLNKIIGRETEEWLVALAFGDCNIYILHPDVLEKQSNHKRDEFPSILIHEITHCYIDKINDRALTWLEEGLALNFAGQKKSSNISKKNLTYFKKCMVYNRVNNQEFSEHDGYAISSCIVNILLKKFSKGDILSLLKIKPIDQNTTKNNIKDILKTSLVSLINQ
jgi:hypothetical protein